MIDNCKFRKPTLSRKFFTALAGNLSKMAKLKFFFGFYIHNNNSFEKKKV